MKILIIHYRFFISGGPERYLFNLKELLEKNGHKVIPFSIRYTKNVKSEYDKYFVNPLSKESEVYFRDQTWNLKSFLKTLERSFYSPEVYKNLKKLINDTKPDFAIVLQFGRKLSPSVLSALYNTKIPFAVRVSDFGMICANAHFLRQQKVCELCIRGDSFYSVRYKCVQNSFGASLVNFLAKRIHHYMGYYNKIKYYIVPSKFTLTKMIEAGFSAERLIHIPTFISNDEIKNCVVNKKRQIIYLGRVDETKGVHILLKAIKILQEESFRDFYCVIAGFGPYDYIKRLQDYLKENNIRNVYFVGQLEKIKLYELLQQSLFSVAPSLLYDNMPNSVLESLAAGTPVIASNHGSFPEIIIDGDTGMLFDPGDTTDLSNKIKILLGNNELPIKMSKNAKKYIKENHSPEKHYENIMNLYDKLRKENKNL
jgi:glycosyltransferase involved in cell wall biosynthesis